MGMVYCAREGSAGKADKGVIEVPYIEKRQKGKKWCWMCASWIDIDEFYFANREKTARKDYCKACDNKRRVRRAKRRSRNAMGDVD